MTESEIGKVKIVRKLWFNDECEDVLIKRKEVRNHWLNNQHNRKKKLYKKNIRKAQVEY